MQNPNGQLPSSFFKASEILPSADGGINPTEFDSKSAISAPHDHCVQQENFTPHLTTAKVLLQLTEEAKFMENHSVAHAGYVFIHYKSLNP